MEALPHDPERKWGDGGFARDPTPPPRWATSLPLWDGPHGEALLSAMAQLVLQILGERTYGTTLGSLVPLRLFVF